MMDGGLRTDFDTSPERTTPIALGSLRCPKPRERVREADVRFPSAPRRFRLHSICAVFVNSIGALGNRTSASPPTFWLSFHLGNRPSSFVARLANRLL